MTKKQRKPFTRTEMKILVFNKVREGFTHEQAKKEIAKMVELVNENHNQEVEKERRKEKKTPKRKNEAFKTAFENLKNGK